VSSRTLPHGSWPSPITAASLVAGAATVVEVRADGHDIWWSESRPDEGGRLQLVRRSATGSIDELFPPPTDVEAWNARTALHEYGGGAWNVRDGVVVFSNWSDQRMYRAGIGAEPAAITPVPSVNRGWRWSEPTWIDDDWLLCVRESHEPDVVAEHGEAMNELVLLPADGRAADDPTLVRVLVTGPDFVHAPAARSDRIAWLQWSHPNMPWDVTTLHTATIERGADGQPVGITGVRRLAGDDNESIVQPAFSDDDELIACSDRSGWWNPYRYRLDDGGSDGADSAGGGNDDGAGVPLMAGVEAEIGGAMWVGGLRWWAQEGNGRVVCCVTADGGDGVGVIADGRLHRLDTPFTNVGQVVAGGDGSTLLVAASPTNEPAVYRLTLDDPPASGAASVECERVSPERTAVCGPEWISVPRHVTFDSAPGRVAHALYYPPTNPDVDAPDGERPPLLVMIHGGPSSAARHRLDLAKQFWTSRGFAVVDVNYGGSTGYGRAYRELLDGQWGVVDVEDAVAAAAYCGDEGGADADRLAIRGGSAGGYTTLAALCFHDTFAAGASHFGVADLSALAADTHKFESRYLDGLVGRWPEDRATYEARSPIEHTDGFDRPLIVLQGSEDEVVPPNQAEMIVAALAAKGVPHAYVLFEGEQHGFRRAESITRALESELWFYGRIFGFEPADDLPDVPGAVGL